MAAAWTGLVAAAELAVTAAFAVPVVESVVYDARGALPEGTLARVLASAGAELVVRQTFDLRCPTAVHGGENVRHGLAETDYLCYLAGYGLNYFGRSRAYLSTLLQRLLQYIKDINML